MYTVGFSNGGEFAASRTAIELSDKMAASISCGGGGALPRDTVLIPKRKLPVMLMFGNNCLLYTSFHPFTGYNERYASIYFIIALFAPAIVFT